MIARSDRRKTSMSGGAWSQNGNARLQAARVGSSWWSSQSPRWPWARGKSDGGLSAGGVSSALAESGAGTAGIGSPSRDAIRSSKRPARYARPGLRISSTTGRLTCSSPSIQFRNSTAISESRPRFSSVFSPSIASGAVPRTARDLVAEVGFQHKAAPVGRDGLDGLQHRPTAARLLRPGALGPRDQVGEAGRDQASQPPATEARPVDPHDAELGRLALDRPLKHRQRLASRDAEDALVLEPVAERPVPGDVADLGQRAPVEGQAGQPEGSPMMGQGVEECIRGGVVSLSRVAQDARERREEDEVVQVAAQRLRVEVPGPAHLGGEDAAHQVAVEVQQHAVFQDHRRVDDAPERGHGPIDLRQDRRQIQRAGDVGLRDGHADALPSSSATPLRASGVWGPCRERRTRCRARARPSTARRPGRSRRARR